MRVLFCSRIVTHVEHKQKTPGVAIAETTSREFALRRWIESLLLVLGCGLLAVFAGAWIQRTVSSRAAIRQFEVLKHKDGDEITGRAKVIASPDPNFVSWSKQRIASYNDSTKTQLSAPLGILRIPRLHLEAPVLEGTDDLTLNRGVGRIDGTAGLGENGNVGIAGHRDSFFRGLKDIEVGDSVELEGPERTDTYVVTDVKIVDPGDVEVLNPRSEPSLTLVTCYPFYFIGSAPKRYIVHASRTSSEQQKHYTSEQGSLTLANNTEEKTQ
jgi:sortase A